MQSFTWNLIYHMLKYLWHIEENDPVNEVKRFHFHFVNFDLLVPELEIFPSPYELHESNLSLLQYL